MDIFSFTVLEDTLNELAAKEVLDGGQCKTE